MFAVFISRIEMQLIGCAIAILGIVAFFMSISQRVKIFLSSNKSNRTNVTPPNFEVKKETDVRGAIHKTIENLDTTLTQDLENVQSQSAEEKKKSAKKSATSTNKETSEEPKTQYSKPHINPNAKFYENGEGFTIIGTSKSGVKTQDKVASTTQVKPQVQQTQQTQQTQVKQTEGTQTANAPQQQQPKPQQTGETQTANATQQQQEQQQQATVSPAPAGIRPQSVTSTAPPAQAQAQQPSADSIMIDETASTLEPRNEFAIFVSRTLMVIRSITSTKTVAFFLINSEKRNLILETFVTDVPDAIITNPKIPMGGDVISQIAMNGKPEILTEIAPAAELDLLPYYTHTTNSHSFIGLPVFYNGAVMGVLCADTSDEDAYDNLTVGCLGHFTKILADLVINYTEKHELRQAARVLSTIEQIHDGITSGNTSINNVASSFIKAGKQIFDYVELGMVCYLPDEKSWKIVAYDSPVSTSKLEGTQVDLSRSILGSVVSTCKTINLPITPQTPVRVTRGELRMPTDAAYFVCVPIYSIKTTYGAIFMTVKTIANITEYDIDMLETIGANIGLIIEQLFLQQEIADTAMVDPETGILNMPAFKMQLEAEIARSRQFKNSLIIMTVALDNYPMLNPTDYYARYNAVLKHIITKISSELKPYELFGRDENDTLYLGFFGISRADVQIWAERIRIDIARTIISFDNQKFTATISGGIAELSMSDTVDSVISNSLAALNRAAAKNNNIQVC